MPNPSIRAPITAFFLHLPLRLANLNRVRKLITDLLLICILLLHYIYNERINFHDVCVGILSVADPTDDVRKASG